MSSCSCTERGKHKNVCSLWRLSYCEEIPVEENEVNDSSSKSSMEAKPEASPQLPKKSVTASTLTSTGSSEAPASVSVLPPLQWHLESFSRGFRWQGLNAKGDCPTAPLPLQLTTVLMLVMSEGMAFVKGKVSKTCLT